MKALVLLHDYGRFVFNGPFPLLYVDGVSDGILRINFPDFPRDFLHSIKWITSEESAPDIEDGQILPLSAISVSQQIGLMLKTIDTVGKLDSNGALIRLEEFFTETGMYKKWVAMQVENDRLPFHTRGNRVVTTEQYALNDQRLTESGARLFKEITGMRFNVLQDKVQDRWTEQHQNSVR